jgi:hypothetical protein
MRVWSDDGTLCVQGGCWDLDDVDDEQEFREVHEALLVLGLRCVLPVLMCSTHCMHRKGWDVDAFHRQA